MISPIQRLAFFGVDSNTKQPSNSNCGSGSLSTMLEDDSSLSCANFPATIWPTSFAGIDVNPEKTTKGWCRIGAEMGVKTLFIARLAWDATGEAVIAQDDMSNGFGSANVRTNDGTTKAGLPCDEDTWATKNALKIQSLWSTKPTLEISNPGREPAKHGRRRTLEEPATSCGEVTAGWDEITNADGLSVALAAEKAASWLLRGLRVLRVLDISCN